VQNDQVVVTTEFTESTKDEMPIQALTYAYYLAMIEDPGLPV